MLTEQQACSFYSSWAPWRGVVRSRALGTVSKQFCDAECGKGSQRLCKDTRLSGFHELEISESGSKGGIAVPHCSQYSVKWDRLSLCRPNCSPFLPLLLCIAYWGKWPMNQSRSKNNFFFLFSFSVQLPSPDEIHLCFQADLWCSLCVFQQSDYIDPSGL